MTRIKEHAPALEAIAAMITALVAVIALFGVKWQLDANAALQAEQSARDIYRAHLALSITHPEFAEPDVCTLLTSPKRPAYEAYVAHALYTSEQVLDAQPGWYSSVIDLLEPHAPYLCSSADWSGYTDAVDTLILTLQKTYCTTAPPQDPCS